MKKPKRRQRKARAVPRRFPPPGMLLPAQQMVTQVPPILVQQPVKRAAELATRGTQTATEKPKRVEMGLQADIRRATREMPTQTEAEPGKELITYQRGQRRSKEESEAERMRQEVASQVSEDKATGRQTDIRRFLK